MTKKRVTKAKPAPKNDRLIFSYFDGQKTRRADPLEIQFALADYPDDLDAELGAASNQGLAEHQPKEVNQATKRVIEAIRTVFAVKPYGEGGLTGRECVGLLFSFFAFVADLKKKEERLRPSPSPTASPASSPTPNTAGSTSTASASSTGAPSQSPSASPSASVETPLEDSGQPSPTPAEKPSTPSK